MAAAKKRPPARRRPPPPPQHVDVSVRGAVLGAVEPWRGLLTFLVAFFGVVAGVAAFWKWGNLPTLVLDRTLHESVSEVESKLRRHVDDTKDKVIEHSNKNTGAVREDVSVLTKTLGLIAKKQDQAVIEQLTAQQRLLFVQRQNVLNSLSSLEVQLAAKPNDQFLTQRRHELESIKANLDRENDAVADQLRRARTQ